MAKVRTPNYIFTADPHSQDDMDKLKLLRQSVKSTKIRITCKGRGYKDEATRKKYLVHRSAYRDISLDDAKTWDVYIHGSMPIEALPLNIFMTICNIRLKNNC